MKHRFKNPNTTKVGQLTSVRQRSEDKYAASPFTGKERYSSVKTRPAQPQKVSVFGSGPNQGSLLELVLFVHLSVRLS